MGLRAKFKWVLPVLLAAILLAGCFPARQGHGNGQDPDKLTGFTQTEIVMDTLVTVQIYAVSEIQAEEAITAAFAEMRRLEDILTAHEPESEIAKVGDNAGSSSVQVSPETLAVISTALEYAEITHGAFDISLAPVLKQYIFPKVEGEQGEIPSPSQLEETLPLVDWTKITLNSDAETVYLEEPGMNVDLGGIAKGYITDRAVDILRKHGIEYGLINSGGDIKLLGPKTDGTPWRVGIKNPHNPLDNFAIIEVSDGSIVTSGDYERFFELEDGVRYHHIIDPHSGLPARGAKSVTVLAPTAELADLLSTAIFVMGPESGMNLVNDLADVEAVYWDGDDRVRYSSGLTRVYDSASVEYHFRPK